jgi:hypothetical protein
MAVSEDVLGLVRTVERLPHDYQDKIFRMVQLLTLVPISVQTRTQQMLRDLLAHEPESKHECVTGIDDIIEYLARNVSMAPEFSTLRTRHEAPMTAKSRLS